MFIVKYSKFGYGSFFLSPHNKFWGARKLNKKYKGYSLNEARAFYNHVLKRKTVISAQILYLKCLLYD